MRFQIKYKKIIGAMIIICILLGVMIITNFDDKERYDIPVKSANIDEIDNRGNGEKKEHNDVPNSAQEQKIIVYISGAVNNPAVVTLMTNSRLGEAVEQAGGLKEDANIEGVNLAMELVDGKQYIIPKIGEELVIVGGEEDEESDGIININKASKSVLISLKGIGEVLAERIVEYREINGDFKSIEEIKKVSGIGDKKFEDIKANIKIN